MTTASRHLNARACAGLFLLLDLGLSWSGISLAQAATSVGERCSALADGEARLACYDSAFPPRLPGHGVAVTRKPTAPAGAAPTPVGADFGLPDPRERQVGLQSVESHIRGSFEGWEPGTRWTLANGQVWTIADGTRTVYPRRSDPAVKVTRSNFGGYFIEIEGVSQSPRVRRVQP